VRWFRFSWYVVPWLLVVLLAIELYPSRVNTSELKSTITRLTADLQQIQSEQEMPATVLRRHRNAICYIYAVYTMEWPAKSVVRMLERHTRVSGTGFLVADNLVATNRHVAEPWFEDDDDQDQIRAGAKPKLEKLIAFFPGLMDPVKLGDVRVSPDQDLAVARLVEGPLPSTIEPLPIAETMSEPGSPVIVVGYPLGISAMLAKSPNALYKRLASSKDTMQVASDLAAHAMIRPSATCGHLGDIVDQKLIYDAPTAQGGSGGPVFNSRGEVIAVNAAYIDGFSGGTIGISTEALKPLIAAAKHRRR
jgi:serine protease Do